MKQVKISWKNFWEGFDAEQYFGKTHAFLKDDYELIFDHNNPDVVFYSVFNPDSSPAGPLLPADLNGNAKRVLIVHECPSRYPYEPSNFHHVIGCDWLPTTHDYMRIPFWVYMTYEHGSTPEDLIDGNARHKRNGWKVGKLSNGFCTFIAANPEPQRMEVCKKLMNHRHVACGGPVMNNIGRRVEGGYDGKIKFMEKYDFNLCFENQPYPGYTTEKIIHPILANVVPIYWGDPTIEKDFNSKRFINANNQTMEWLIEKVIEIDGDDEKYFRMVNEPIFLNNDVPECAKKENLLSFYGGIFDKV